MKYTVRQERVRLAMRLIDSLVGETKSIKKLSEELNAAPHTLLAISRRLKAAKLLTIHFGQKGGLRKTEDCVSDEYSVNRALGYPDPNKAVRTRCYECDEVKPRMRKVEEDRIVFCNPDGRVWHGLLCPDCIAEMSEKVEEEPLTLRKCRKCKVFLPVSRYFECKECKPVLISDDAPGTYAHMGGDAVTSRRHGGSQ